MVGRHSADGMTVISWIASMTRLSIAAAPSSLPKGDAAWAARTWRYSSMVSACSRSNGERRKKLPRFELPRVKPPEGTFSEDRRNSHQLEGNCLFSTESGGGVEHLLEGRCRLLDLVLDGEHLDDIFAVDVFAVDQ